MRTGDFGQDVYGPASGPQHIAAPPAVGGAQAAPQAGGDGEMQKRRSERQKRRSERNKSNRNKSQRGGKNKNRSNKNRNKSEKNRRQRGGKWMNSNSSSLF